MTEAADLARELANKLEQSIGEAQRLQREEERDQREKARDRRSNRQWIVGSVIAVIGVIVSLLIGFLVGREHPPADKDGDGSAHTKTAQDSPQAPPGRGP